MYAPAPPPPLPDQWSSTLLEKDYLALSLALHTRAVEAARTGHWVTDDDIVIVERQPEPEPEPEPEPAPPPVSKAPVGVKGPYRLAHALSEPARIAWEDLKR